AVAVQTARPRARSRLRRHGRTFRRSRAERSRWDWRRNAQIIEQHITDPTAEYDAERDPNDEIIQIGHAHRHRTTPQPWQRNNGARTNQTCDNPNDIGERVPAHRE